eukprot:2078920-Amphidinium_carterae.1
MRAALGLRAALILLSVVAVKLLAPGCAFIGASSAWREHRCCHSSLQFSVKEPSEQRIAKVISGMYIPFAKLSRAML